MHPTEQVAQLTASIAEFGFNVPVLVDDAPVLIAGHGRVLAAKALGLDAVPASRLSRPGDPPPRARPSPAPHLLSRGAGALAEPLVATCMTRDPHLNSGQQTRR
jgi:hypothetical protein